METPKKRVNLSFLRRWGPLQFLVLLLVVATYAAAAINGWGWSLKGSDLLDRLQAIKTKLKVHPPLMGRIVMVAPHPDDEVLANGGMLADAVLRGQQVYVILITAGDSFPWHPSTTIRAWLVGGEPYRELGEQRIEEFLASTQELGIPRDHVFVLGFADRSISALGSTHFLAPYTSPSTKVDHIPYSQAYKPGRPYTGVELERQLRQILSSINPDILIGPGVLEGHGDHNGTAFFITRVSTSYPKARLYYNVIHGGLEWPLPKGYHPNLPLVPPGEHGDQLAWQVYPLPPEAIERKARAIEQHHTQTQIMGRYMRAFIRQNELLLPAPRPLAP